MGLEGSQYGTPQSLTAGSVPTFGGIVLPDTMPAAQRGVVGSLGRAVGVNLNALASTTIFTVPAAGVNRCVVLRVERVNDSGASTTASLQFGTAGGADWAATAVNANAATGHYQELSSAANLSPVYTAGQTFQVTVTIVQGVAGTADFRAIGYYE